MTQITGKVFVRLPGGDVGPAVAGALVEFIKEDGSSTSTARSGSQGRYALSLPLGRYYLRATHAAYEDYTSAPVSLVATLARQTCDFFLGEPQITTVIVIRHGEKLNADSTTQTEPLSETGQRRALMLREILFRVGVTRIFHTDTVRSRDTAKPLAKALRLDPTIYTYDATDEQIRLQSAQRVAQEVLQHHRGDVVLVVAHSDSIKQVVTALGASADIGSVADFDSMFVVSCAGADVNVLNLQYFVDSPPDSAINIARAMTVVLVGVGGASARVAQLKHAVRGSGISAIFVNQNQTGMVSPLVTTLGINAESYQPTEIPQLVERLLADYQSETVVVSGTHDDLRAVIRRLGGKVPILNPSEVNNLIVLTRFASGAVRVLPMRL